MQSGCRRGGTRAARGFTLLELTLVTMLLVILIVIAVPVIRSLMVEILAPSVSRDLQRAVVTIRQSRAVSSMLAAPYISIGLAELGSALRETSFEVRPAAPALASSISHPLGSGAGTPDVSVETGRIVVDGDSFVVRLANVAWQACSAFAASFSRQAHSIEISPQGGVASIVKASGGAFDAQSAQAACAHSNLLVFTFR